jgi:hypothetical protein
MGFSDDSYSVPHGGGELFSSGPPPRDLWGRLRGTAPATLLIVGLLVGGGAGAGAVLASSDPTESTEYQALEHKLRSTEAQVAAQKNRAEAAERAVDAAAAEVRIAREALIAGQLPGELRQAAHP